MKKIKKGESACTSQAIPAWLRLKVLAKDKHSGLFNETKRKGFIMWMTTVVNIKTCCFFVTYKETEKARVFVPCKPFQSG